jgi:hypothetical protein
MATQAATSKAALAHKMLRKNRSSMGAKRGKRGFVPLRSHLGKIAAKVS